MNRSLLPYIFNETLYDFAPPTIVVLARPWPSYTAAEQVILERLLTAVSRLDPAPVVRVLVHPELDVASLKALSPGRVLVFGSKTQQEVPLYAETTALGLRMIKADDLSALDEPRKKNLWIALKKMFAGRSSGGV